MADFKISKNPDIIKFGVIGFLFVILLLRSCSTSNTLARMERRIQTMDSIIAATPPATKQEVDGIVTQRLYDFLIFEDDLDKKKTSLSDIKIKIQKNEK